MAKEIERKYLVINDSWKKYIKTKKLYRQGYIPTASLTVVRVRISDNIAYLTIKGQNDGITRLEYEYPIPIGDANEIIKNFCPRPLIEKKRFEVLYNGLVWEIDVFFGENEGLIIAEIELKNQNQKINLPPWIGKEVSDDPKYYNVNLIQNPFKKWFKSL